MGDESGHGRSTGMVRTEHLPQEHPERDQGRVEAVLPRNINFLKRWRDRFFGEHICKWEVALLKKLTAQKSELFPKPTLAKIPHPEASLAGDGWIDAPIIAKEALLPMLFRRNHFRDFYVPFGDATDAG